MIEHEASRKFKGRVLRINGVCELISCSPATIWRWVKNDPDFPKSFKLSPSLTVWDEAELLGWIDQKKKLRSVA